MPIFDISMNKAASKLETLKYAAFPEEFLPKINTLSPTWAGVERPRSLYGNKRVAGLLNICQQPRQRMEPVMDLSEYPAASFWLSVVDESERPSSDQTANGRPLRTTFLPKRVLSKSEVSSYASTPWPSGRGCIVEVLVIKLNGLGPPTIVENDPKAPFDKYM